jgi:CO/xanthine dehydrogenase FAD-binding subunit
MDVLTPRSLSEALDMKEERPEAVPIAGGTDLMVAMNFGHTRPSAIVDLTRVDELRSYFLTADRVELGALTTFAEIISAGRFRALVEASRTVGSPQIRNRATVGGNLATASPAGDSIPVLYAYDAEIVLGSSGSGSRTIPIERFFTGPKETVIEPSELILGATWKRPIGSSTFSKIGTRNAMVISVASLCAAIDAKDRRARIALGSVGPTVVRATEAETILTAALEETGFWEGESKHLPESAIENAADATAEAARPIDDVRGSAGYRRQACRVMARRAIRWVLYEPEEPRPGVRT